MTISKALPTRAGVAKRKSFPAAVIAMTTALTALLVSMSCGVAGAAVTHRFNKEASEALGHGVPVGCGVGATEPPCISGALSQHPLSEVKSLAVVEGRVWVGDSPDGVGGSTRIDQFATVSPWAFVGPQIDEEAGVSGIGARIAVGHIGGEAQVYTTASHERQGVIAVYGASTGKLLGTWTGAHTLNGSFTRQAGEPVALVSGVAVDRSANFETAGDVYVTTFDRPSFDVVDVFAAKPAGTVGEEPAVVATLTGTCATPGTSCPGATIPFGQPLGVAVSPRNGDVFVTDVTAAAQTVVDVFAPGPMHEYVFVRQFTGPPGGFFRSVTGVAADPETGDVYVADTSPGSETTGVVYQFSEGGTFLGRIETTASGPLNAVHGVGVDALSHEVFVGEVSEAPGGPSAAVDVFGPDLVLPDVETSAASGVRSDREGHIAATLNGTVDPLTAGPATCRFVWGVSEAFGRQAPCAQKEILSPTGVSALLEGLQPDTSYFFRLQASNVNGANPGEAPQDKQFKTPGPGIHSVSSSEVAATSASLDGQVDPNNAATSVFFQYTTAPSTAGCGSGAGACQLAPAAAGGEVLGSGSGDVGVHEHVQGLLAGTTYHYRLVVLSELEVAAGVTAPVVFFGVDHLFQTDAGGSTGAGLLDSRQWELVSPADKHGGVILAPGRPGSEKSSLAGGMLAYPTDAPTEAGAAGFGEFAQVLSRRDAGGGWSTHDIALAHAQPVGATFGVGAEYRAFSEDLCSGVVEPQGPFTSLTPEVFPPDSERTPYVRNDCTHPGEPTTTYAPVATGAQGYADVRPETKFGAEEGMRIPSVGAVNFVGASPDLKHVIVASRIQLTESATPPGVKELELYEWSAEKPPSERLQLVSLDQANQPSKSEAGLGFETGPGNQADGRGAVSGDGSRVFWSEHHGGLFVRDVGMGVSLRLDTVQGGSGVGPVVPVFQGASANGGRVFFTDQQRLTADAGAVVDRPDLYVCDVVVEAGSLRCALKDLTPLSGGESAAVHRVVSGISGDGSWVYFVANGVLGGAAGEGAVPGDCGSSGFSESAVCNLYVVHDGASGWGAPRLVAVLSDDDFPAWGGGSAANLAGLTARVSPDGTWFVFMSDRSLTGYDNRDAVSEKPDEEVYLYHASAEGAGRLVCVSCARSGARPEGVEYARVSNGLVGGYGGVWADGQWLAGSVPGFEQYHLTQGLYQPRFLSDSGRVFFDAAGGLVPGDVNHNQDVYEWEPAGAGGCAEGAASYDPATGGCLGLVSSGRAAGESAFVDASETGEDVFFLTGERLVRADTDTAVDMYDAHACSATAPCPLQAEVPLSCVTADACRPAPSPAPSLFGAPASATFSGQGNLAPQAALVPKTRARSVRCKKNFVRNRNRCVKKPRAKKTKRANSKRRAGR